jgi:hypothetical protein
MCAFGEEAQSGISRMRQLAEDTPIKALLAPGEIKVALARRKLTNNHALLPKAYARTHRPNHA